MIIIGGTGTIGTEVTKIAIRQRNSQVVVVSRDGTKQIRTYADLGHPDNLEFYIRDVSEPDWTEGIPIRPQEIVINLAALKHVPACEKNPMQSIRNNVHTVRNSIGTGGIHVMVSSDKAVNPTNIYGMTKHIAEKLTLQSGGRVVRLGNVRGSRGSVIPLSKRKAKSDGVVHLTHTEMKRWFISKGRAAGAIMDTVLHGEDGEVHIPEAMSEERIEPKLEEIAEEHDAELEIIGKREGEKLREQLTWNEEEIKWV